MRAVIRDEARQDRAAVAALLTRAFPDEPAVCALEVLLEARDDSFGFVAVDGDAVVGHVRLTRSWIDAAERAVEVLVLSPLSVDPEHQGRGMGRALIAHALERAEARAVPAVFLEGDPGYYGRLGWHPAAQIGVTPPSERIPRAACQVAVLPGYEHWMRGRLVYADAFWATDTVGLREPTLSEVRAALGEATP